MLTQIADLSPAHPYPSHRLLGKILSNVTIAAQEAKNSDEPRSHPTTELVRVVPAIGHPASM